MKYAEGVGISQQANILIKYIKIYFIIAAFKIRFSITGVELLCALVISHMQVLLKAASHIAFVKASLMKYPKEA